MAPMALKKLTALQISREVEIRNIGTRLANRSIEDLNKNILDARLRAVKEIWIEIRKTNSEIIVRDDIDKDPYVEEKWFERIEGVYEKTLDEILTKISWFDSQDNFSRPSEGDTASSVAKLPRIPLPTFSGKYEDWPSFCDLFTTLVHDTPRISDATKLQYLKLCLTGKAAELIKDVETTNANYAGTWRALNARYRNPRFIINKLLSSLMGITPLKRESAMELRAFLDEAQRIVRSLKNLGLPIEHWDVWLIFVLSNHLDAEKRKLWECDLSAKEQRNNVGNSGEESLLSNSLPKFCELIQFLEQRAQALSMIAPERQTVKRPVPMPLPPVQPRKALHARSSSRSETSKCPLCFGMHSLAKCFKLKNKNPYDPLSIVRRLQVCFNCLGSHRVHTCTSAARCTICQKKHHTMLHLGTQKEASVTADSGQISQGASSRSNAVVSSHAATVFNSNRRIILATAKVEVRSPLGESTYVRALLDQGSECSFLSESIVQLLRLPKQRTCVSLSGVGACAAGTARLMTRIIIASTVDSSFQIETDALVLPRLTSQLPSNDINYVDFRHLAGFTLADPQFYIWSKIDLILGADVYSQLLLSGLKRLPSSNLVAQNTVLGWIVSGAVPLDASRRAGQGFSDNSSQTLHCTSMPDVDDLLQKFWTLEEVSVLSSTLKPEHEACEQMFKDMYSRNLHGRYEVGLPLRTNPPAVASETRQIALRSLSCMHRRFARDAKVAQAYRDFMNDYERLGHMEKIRDSEIHREDAWYLPHHAIVHDSLGSRKIRVVFDASRRTRDGTALNDFLHAGAPLQSDLSLILLNWRKYLYVFTADIVKMFRQIHVKREHQDFQRILWSPSVDAEPADYRLTTVTYGTSCAPFLAIRTLLQLVHDEGSRFPLGAECLKCETYVDDTFAGADDLSTAIQKRIELTDLLGTAGIELNKWAANSLELLPPQAEQSPTKQIDADSPVKTLGVQWHPALDQFGFHVSDIAELTSATTKRAILSNIARLFDPLGWLSPITVTAKILMQDLWIEKCDWDTPLQAEHRERWTAYCDSLSNLSSLKIDRWLGILDSRSYQLHGFSDASSRASAAVIYLRVDEGNGKFRISLLAAKTKTAPVKTVSIPNLELCGAALLVKLFCHVRSLAVFSRIPVYAWSDSQIVLTWLRKHPCQWKTFVANRVSYIQTELPSAIWAHVPTKDNPADVATRGAAPDELLKIQLRWHGPSWLSSEPEFWPQPKPIQNSLHTRKAPSGPELLSRFSFLLRLIRVIAWCRRPLVSLRRRKSSQGSLHSFLTTSELSEARAAAIRISQASDFADEITSLKAGKKLPPRGRLSRLNPFLASDEILRVGGRLAHSGLSFEHKHPPILAQKSVLSELLVKAAHQKCLHGGPTLTTSVLMQQAWILGRRKLVKSVIRHCVTCQRVSPQPAQQLMGDLPADRVSVRRPFAISGLDYAGPVQIRTTKGRGHRSYKGYIVVFVCFSTKAIHLELVSDLTSASFISAYRRFVGRRGICQKLVSDNATNFHGADKELHAMFKRASSFYESTASLLAQDGTEWEFIPPSAPHYGGLWEAGVKSVKHHLKRIIGEHTLTFEELSTVLVEIEACLNSRPLGALSADIDDLQALTPFHFLSGCSSALLPESDLSTVPRSRLDRFQLLQRLRNQYWKRWSSEYLLHLQERHKWRGVTENFRIGRLVLIKDDRYPPSKWPLGRIIEVHAGPDGLVRVATVKTITGSLRRHIHRLCPLHLKEEGTDA